MSLENEIKARFGGIWNSIVVIFVVIVCLRFSSLAVVEDDLGERISYALCLFFIALGVGFALGILKIFFSYSNEPHSRLSGAANFASGLKYGFVAVGVLIFIVGVMQLENFLGPLQSFLGGLFG
jgi:hypothetical protein